MCLLQNSSDPSSQDKKLPTSKSIDPIIFCLLLGSIFSIYNGQFLHNSPSYGSNVEHGRYTDGDRRSQELAEY